MSRSIFFEEWRKCLQAHYRDVVRRNDLITQRTLVPVMHRVGFTEDELRSLYIEATMHIDALVPDFVPDLAQFTDTAFVESTPLDIYPEQTFIAHAAECSCPACMDKVDILRHDDEGQPLATEAIIEKIAQSAWQQKSLF